jgi:hypothetical protein
MTHVVMVMSGFPSHPCALSMIISELYLSRVVLMAWSMYLLCANMTTIMWMVRLGDNMIGFNYSCGTLCLCNMLGRNLARHMHFMVWHVHCRSHDGMVLYWELLSFFWHL